MSVNNFMTQQNFLNQLGKYVNHGSLNKTDILLGYPAPSLPFYKNAKHICVLHSNLHNTASEKSIDVKFLKYSGTNHSALKLADFIKTNLLNDVKCILIHGSIATNEEIAYSDFDALVILKDELFKSPKRLAKASINLSKCYSLMLEFDPLQHHGWFAMSESDLNNYPKTYLPLEVLPYCCSLIESTELRISIPEENPADNSFLKLVNSLTKQLHSKYKPVNLFLVKSILSEFMMLPTLFIQQKTKNGIYKKLSFEKARNYFTGKEWMVMDEVSDIRKNWDSSEAKLNFKTPCIISVAKKKNQKAHAPKVPENLLRIFQSGLATRMLEFIETMKKKSDET